MSLFFVIIKLMATYSDSAGSYNIQWTRPTKSDRRVWVQTDFSGGFVSSGTPANAAPNQVRYLTNFDVQKGGILSKREGTKIINSLLNIGDAVQGSITIFPTPEEEANKTQKRLTFWLSDGFIYDSNTKKIPYYSYVENNDVIKLELSVYAPSGNYVENNPNDENYVPLLGEGVQYQLYENVIYWLIGNKIYMYPYKGQWRFNTKTLEDGTTTSELYIDYYNGQPQVIEGENLGAKLWLELYHYQPYVDEFFNPGVNLLSTDPKNRVIKFIPTVVAGVKFTEAKSSFDGVGYTPIIPTTLRMEVYDIFDRKNQVSKWTLEEGKVKLWGRNTDNIDITVFSQDAEVYINGFKLGNFNYNINNGGGDNYIYWREGNKNEAEVTTSFNPITSIDLTTFNDRVDKETNYTTGNPLYGYEHQITLNKSRGTAWEYLDWNQSQGLSDPISYDELENGVEIIDDFEPIQNPQGNVIKEHFIINTKNEFYNYINYSNNEFKIDVISKGSAFIGNKHGEGDVSWSDKKISLTHYQDLIKIDRVKSFIENPLLVENGFTWYVLSTNSMFMTLRGAGNRKQEFYIEQRIKYFNFDNEFYYYSKNTSTSSWYNIYYDNIDHWSGFIGSYSRDKSGIFEFNFNELNLPNIHLESKPTSSIDFEISVLDKLDINFRKTHSFNIPVDIDTNEPDFTEFKNFFLNWAGDNFDTFVTGWNEENLGTDPVLWFELNEQIAKLKETIDNIENGVWTYVSNDPIQFVYELVNLNLDDLDYLNKISYELRLRFEGNIYYLEETVKVGVATEFKHVGIISKSSPILVGIKTDYQLITSAKNYDDSNSRYYQWQTYLLKDITTDVIIEPNYSSKLNWTQGINGGMFYSFISVTPNEQFVIYAFSISEETYDDWTDTVGPVGEYVYSSSQFQAIALSIFNYQDIKSINNLTTVEGFHIYKNQMLLYSGSNIWISQLFNFGYFPSSYVFALGDLTTKVNIQSIQYVQGTLIILTNQNIYTLSGSSPLDFSLNQINADYGTIAKYSPYPMENGVAFLTNQGIYKLTNLSQTSKDNLNVQRLDTKIQDLIEELPFENKIQAVSILWRNKYLLAIPNTNVTPSGEWMHSIYIYDSLYKSWTKWDSTFFDILNFFKDNKGNLLFSRKSSPELLIYGYQKLTNVNNLNLPVNYIPGYQDGYINNFERFSKPVNSFVQTVEYNLGKKAHNKKFKKLYVITAIPDIMSTFDIRAYTEEGILLDSSRFVITRNNSGSYDIIEYTDINQETGVRNAIIKGSIMSKSNYDLALYDTINYNNTKSFLQYTFNLSGVKAKTITIEILHTDDAALDVYWLGLDFKLKKAK